MQKKLETPESAHWNSPLLQDLSFIKKHLRYPVNKRTFWPFLWILYSIAMVLFLVIIIVVSNSASYHKRIEFTANNFLPLFSISIVFFTLGLMIYRRMQNFRFISIGSDFIISDNIKLIEQFLLKQNIAFFHNPAAPEVYQISSRILDVASGQREIMVFLADDKRILVNSHFTTLDGYAGLKQTRSGNHKQMAGLLKQWLKENKNHYTTQFNLKISGK